MPIIIQPITAYDIPSAIRCIQLSFADDPYAVWVFDKAHFNRDRNFYSLKAKCEWGIRNACALFYVAKDTDAVDPDEVVGVSMWMKPRNASDRQTWREWMDDYVLWLEQAVNLLWYQGRGGLRTDRYWIWKREQAKAQTAIWTDEHGYYFCNIVTVLPKCQGKGIGRLLFEVVTTMADEEGRSCYLESSRDEPNVKIYNKMGFEMSRKMVCVAEDGTGEECDLFCMVRPPQR